MSAVAMDVTTVDGNNLDLNDPIGFGIRRAGGSVSSIALVVDADVLTVGASDVDQLLDLSELRLLFNIKGAWAKTDISAGLLTEKLGDFAKQIDEDIKMLKEHMLDSYGIGGSTISSGSIRLDFQTTMDDVVLND